MPSPRPLPKDRRSGFALLITITLLAFLVLLLVSLATLTRVETQVASNTQQLSKARQNALLALNIALGQLQLMLGPDQRVTAPAAQQGDGTAPYTTADVDNNANWVGVYRQDPTTTTRSPQLLNWLVSGNQTLTVPASGANTPTVVPNSIVTGISATTTVTTPVTVGGKNAVLLVGPASVTSAGFDRFVAAKLEQIQVPESTLPGFNTASTTPTTIGNFAYWVGDEGVKAKVSLSDPWKNAAAATLTATGTNSTDADTFSFFGTQRSGIEGMSSTGADTATTNKIDTAYPASTDATFRTTLPKVLSLPQLPLSYATGQSTLSTAIKSRFHDLTASSYTVLADVSLGGLKRDLTAWVGRPADSPLGSDLIPLDSSLKSPVSPFTPYTTAERYGLPKWGIIRSYANLVNDGTAKTAIAQTDQQQGLFPVMTFGRLGLATSCEGATKPLKLNLFPHLVLWNPYNVPIKGSFEYCIGFPWNTRATFKVGATSATSVTKFTVYMGAASMTGPTLQDTSSVLPFVYFRFLLNTPATGIAPGQSLAFTLNVSGTYASGTNVMEANDPVRTDNSVTIDGPAMSATEITQSVFCSVASGNMDLLLCPVFAGPGLPTSAQLIASAYQMAHLGDGFGTPGSTIPSGPAQPSLAVVAPVMDYRLSMNFSRNRTYTDNPRWLTNLNPRAGIIIRKRSYFCFTFANPYAVPPAVQGNENSAGDGIDPAVLSSTVVRPVISELPPSGLPLFSIAQLQHAGLSLINLNPIYAVGNSYAPYYTIPRDQTSVASVTTDAGSDQVLRIFDLSYLLNQALWDRYFFSTVPTSLTSANQLTADYHLPNARNEFYWRANAATEFNELTTTAAAASHLLVNGGFSVNSTSIQAWRALLYSHNGAPPSGAGPTEKHPFSRFTQQSGTPNSTWLGYRVLTDAQIDNLAANIVAQVKIRGPFLSLADFVNRRLVDIASTTDDERLKGTLQAALDGYDNGSGSSYTNNVNFRAPFRSTDSAYRILAGAYPSDGYPSSITSEKEAFRGGADASAPYASMAAGAPGFLTQADLLNSLGPILTARSDTFRIRTYGDTVNPSTGLVEGKAWCEAVVQRLPDYVDASMAAETDLSTAAASTAKTTNQTFGRRFKIVSFRWLASNDI